MLCKACIATSFNGTCLASPDLDFLTVRRHWSRAGELSETYPWQFQRRLIQCLLTWQHEQTCLWNSHATIWAFAQCLWWMPDFEHGLYWSARLLNRTRWSHHAFVRWYQNWIASSDISLALLVDFESLLARPNLFTMFFAELSAYLTHQIPLPEGRSNIPRSRVDELIEDVINDYHANGPIPQWSSLVHPNAPPTDWQNALMMTPMIARLVRTPFDREKWFFELKWGVSLYRGEG